MPKNPSSEVLLDILRDLTEDLLGAPNLEAMLWIVARTVMNALDYEDCVLYLVNDERTHLVQRAAHGPKSPAGAHLINPISIPIGHGIVGACVESGEPVLVDDTHLDDRYIVDDQIRRSELAVPLIDSDVVIGVIDSEHSEVGFYTDDDLQALVDIARIAAVRLHAAMSTEQLEETVNELEATKLALDIRLRTDHLTGLANRQGFEDRLEGVDGGPGALALVDLDSFKEINDTLGHAAGDRALIDVARVMNETRPDGGFVARLGGDEFGLLAPTLDTLLHWCNRILQALRDRATRPFANQVAITASVGLVERHRNGGTWGLADDALFVAKAAGGDQLVVHHDQDVRLQELKIERSWATKIRRGLETNFVLLGQPIVRASDPKTVEMYEVLLRYAADSGDLIPPSAFLPVAEKFRLFEDIDRWVVAEAVAWLGGQPDSVRVAANVASPFIESTHAIKSLERILDESAVDPSRLCLEITESIAIADEAVCAEFLRIVRGWGCSVAVDDFGRGWSALPLVRDMNVDILKIDGAWVQQTAHDDLARTVVRSIVEVSEILGVKVVAEWVESRAVADYLRDLGVDLLQGFHIGRPARLAAPNSPKPRVEDRRTIH